MSRENPKTNAVANPRPVSVNVVTMIKPIREKKGCSSERWDVLTLMTDIVTVEYRAQPLRQFGTRKEHQGTDKIKKWWGKDVDER